MSAERTMDAGNQPEAQDALRFRVTFHAVEQF